MFCYCGSDGSDEKQIFRSHDRLTHLYILAQQSDKLEFDKFGEVQALLLA